MNLEPVIFCEGSDFFDNLAKKYKTHKAGFFVMAPSGAGKTYFCKKQTEPNWIDGDDLWVESNAQPRTEWWNYGVPVINQVEQRCDVITDQAVERGFWILGSVNYWLKPDAIVIPDWDILVKQIKMRQESGEYDGGLTDAHHKQLKTHIGIISEWNIRHGVPQFKSIEEATNYLTRNLHSGI